MKIIDTHQHLWDIDRFDYSWLKGNRVLNRSFRIDDYIEAIRGLNVVKSVHLEADVDERFMWDETLHLLELAGRDDNPLEGIVACGRPESREFRRYLERIPQYPRIKGIRRVLHTQPDTLGQTARFIENVGALAGYNLSFDICVMSRQLPIAINLVKECPDVTFILDHCGVPEIKAKLLDPWRLHIEEIARMDNVTCKISGLIAYADPTTWTFDDLQPYVEHVIACFGWDRVLFGSDWPVCTTSGSYKQWVEALERITASAGEVQQTKLFHDNARRIYRLDES